jgi:Transcriptional regulators
VKDPATGGDVSTHQASILDHLDEVDATSMTDLAGHMGVTVATMSLAIDRLEGRAYVRRDRDSGDRRRVLLRLTAAGARVREAKSVLDPVRVEQVLGQLSPNRPRGCSERPRPAGPRVGEAHEGRGRGRSRS